MTGLHVDLLVARHARFGRCDHSVSGSRLVNDGDVGGLSLVLGMICGCYHSSHADRHFFTGGLLLAFVDSVQVWSGLLLS